MGVRPRHRPPHGHRPPRRGRRASCRRLQWRDQLYKEARARTLPVAPASCRVIPTDRPWTLGDNVNLAVGQGDLQADPLQMAVAYAAIGNGGDVVRPHVGKDVEDSERQRRAGDRPGADPSPGHQPELPRGDHGGNPRGGPVTGRDLLSGVRQLPDPDGGQDGYGPAPGAGGPVVVRVSGARIRTRRSSSRRRSSRAASASRPRRRSREQILTAYYDEHPAEAKKAGGKPPKRRPISTTAPIVEQPLLMVSDAYPRPFEGGERQAIRARVSAAGCSRWTRCCSWRRSG